MSEFQYAQRNGFTGTQAEYVAKQYAAYVATCERCGIAPATEAHEAGIRAVNRANGRKR